MPEITSIQSSNARASIARASAATGVDFDYLLAQAKIESNLDSAARARTSSASGLYQFISSTWLETVDRHGKAHGLDWAEAAITRTGGRANVGDEDMRARIMAMRFDPDISSLMAAELARDNASELRGFLGREPDHAELYLAHFLGAGGARLFLGALNDNPLASAAGLLPDAARANRAIFYDGWRPRAVGEVMELVRGKIEYAKNGGSDQMSPNLAGASHQIPYAAGFDHARRTFATAEPARIASRAPFTDTLKAVFGRSDQLGSSAGRQVADAYGKFKALGL